MIKKGSIYFHLMNNLYFDEFSSYKEFQNDFNRGHGVLIVDINSLLIAIPLRSKIKPYFQNKKHLFPYSQYVDDTGNLYLKALDFSKLMIIEEKHINKTTNYIFKDIKEKTFYLENFNRIYTRVNNYIQKYISLCNSIENNKNISKYSLEPYRYSTLINFHDKLGINVNKATVIEKINAINS